MEVTLQQLEDQLKDQKTLVAQRDLAIKLSKNADFRKLILQEFCVEESARYAHASGNPQLSADERADALNIAQAAGHLKRWLSIKVQMGNTAEDNIFQLNAAIEEMRAAPEGETEEGAE